MAHQVLELQNFDVSMLLEMPLYACRVPAGFPSPAEDYLDDPLDLNRKLIENPCATFAVRVEGESMKDAGIFPDDILIVDRSRIPKSGDVVVGALNGELFVKYLFRESGRISLRAANPRYAPIPVVEGDELQIWGVARWGLHCLH